MRIIRILNAFNGRGKEERRLVGAGLDWDKKITWQTFMALLSVLSVAWIAVSRVPVEAAAVRHDRPPLPRAGYPAPDFTLETLDGKTVTLSDLHGQVVLINFWATWCPPCRAEMPAIQQVYDEYRGRGFGGSAQGATHHGNDTVWGVRLFRAEGDSKRLPEVQQQQDNAVLDGALFCGQAGGSGLS